VPSAALVKAMLINSAVSVGGSVQSSTTHPSQQVEVGAIPSHIGGWGRIKLDRSLAFLQPLTTPTDGQYYPPIFNLTVYDGSQQVVNQGEHLSYCFNVQSEYPFKVTLVWTDKAGSPSSQIILVNNLDLAVVDESNGTLHIGNGVLPNTPSLEWDELNNVEQVNLPATTLSSGLYSVHVIGRMIPSSPQRFALVVTGRAQQVPLNQCSGTVVCPNGCSGHGECSPLGVCNCDPQWATADCSVAAKAIPWGDNPLPGRVAPEHWQYYYFEVSEDVLPVNITLNVIRTSTVGDPDIYINTPDDNGFPTMAKHTKADLSCDTCSSGGVTRHHIDLPPRVGSYKVAVWGYCCDTALYTISVTGTLRPIHRSSTAAADHSSSAIASSTAPLSLSSSSLSSSTSASIASSSSGSMSSGMVSSTGVDESSSGASVKSSSSSPLPPQSSTGDHHDSSVSSSGVDENEKRSSSSSTSSSIVPHPPKISSSTGSINPLSSSSSTGRAETSSGSSSSSGVLIDVEGEQVVITLVLEVRNVSAFRAMFPRELSLALGLSTNNAHRFRVMNIQRLDRNHTRCQFEIAPSWHQWHSENVDGNSEKEISVNELLSRLLRLYVDGVISPTVDLQSTEYLRYIDLSIQPSHTSLPYVTCTNGRLYPRGECPVDDHDKDHYNELQVLVTLVIGICLAVTAIWCTIRRRQKSQFEEIRRRTVELTTIGSLVTITSTNIDDNNHTNTDTSNDTSEPVGEFRPSGLLSTQEDGLSSLPATSSSSSSSSSLSSSSLAEDRTIERQPLNSTSSSDL